MSTRGRRPVPTALRVLRGNPSKRPLNPDEPKLRIELPPAPAHLSPEARKEWRRAGRVLAQAGLLTRIDSTALALYAGSYARWAEAEGALQKFGLMVRGANGLPAPSPYLAVATKAMEQLRQLLGEFGMTPASRSRVQAEPVDDEEEDELDRLRARRPPGRDRFGMER